MRNRVDRAVKVEDASGQNVIVYRIVPLSFLHNWYLERMFIFI